MTELTELYLELRRLDKIANDKNEDMTRRLDATEKIGLLLGWFE